MQYDHIHVEVGAHFSHSSPQRNDGRILSLTIESRYDVLVLFFPIFIVSGFIASILIPIRMEVSILRLIEWGNPLLN